MGGGRGKTTTLATHATFLFVEHVFIHGTCLFVFTVDGYLPGGPEAIISNDSVSSYK